MSCCCTNKYKFCQKISGCSVSNLAYLFKGLADGNYIIELEFLRSLLRIQMSVSGTTFVIEGPELNENYTYNGRLFNDAGHAVPFIVNNIQYDCFEFSTVMVYGYSGDMDGSTTAPPVTIGDVVDAITWYNVTGEIPSGVVDGSNATFTTQYAFAPDDLAVYINGLLQKNGLHYLTSNNNTIIFNESPEVGDIIEVDYIKQ